MQVHSPVRITLEYNEKIRPTRRGGKVSSVAVGDPGVIRTRSLRFRKPSLYPAELRGHWLKRFVKRFAKRVNLRQCMVALPLAKPDLVEGAGALSPMLQL